jgi:hypothetical protein
LVGFHSADTYSSVADSTADATGIEISSCNTNMHLNNKIFQRENLDNGIK